MSFSSNKRLSSVKAGILLLLLPFLSHADSFDDEYGTFAAFARFLVSLKKIINLLIPVVVGVALLFFFWGLTRFIANAGDESAQAAGKRIMIVGIIAFTVMSSIWGIVGFVQESFGIQNTTIEIPGQF